MSDRKFREFWISEDECLPTFFYSPKDFTDYYTQMIELQARLDMPTPVHVIEKSAYDAITKERDELKAALKELDTKRWELLADLEKEKRQHDLTKMDVRTGCQRVAELTHAWEDIKKELEKSLKENRDLVIKLERWQDQAELLEEAVQACCDHRHNLIEQKRVYYATVPPSVICGRAYARFQLFKEEWGE